MATKNLFVCPLGDVSVADIRAFLNLESDEDARPSEGERLDFKSNWIDDLGNLVAGFANTYGGLILLGITEKTGESNRPDAIVGVPRKGEIKGRIVGHIEATVRPRPRVEVHSLPIDRDRDVAIVRVSQGDEPPYMYSRAGKHCVPVRVEDQTRAADYAQLDALIRRRTESVSATQDPFSFEQSFEVIVSKNGINRTTYQGMWVRPVARSRLVLDASQESMMERAIRKGFVHDTKGIKSLERRLHSIDLISDVDLPDHQRKWRLLSEGSFGFSTQIKHPNEDRVDLVDIVRDSLSFLRAARDLWRSLEIGGRLYYLYTITAPGLRLHNNPGSDQEISGIRGSEDTGRGRGNWSQMLDSSNLAIPVPMIAQALAAVLREEWGIQTRLSKLEESIGYHEAELFDQHGRPERAVRIVIR
jgi:hypothetical protein